MVHLELGHVQTCQAATGRGDSCDLGVVGEGEGSAGQTHPHHIDLHIVAPGPCPHSTHQLSGGGRGHCTGHASNSHGVVSC